jgi:hypothetical protein
MTGLVLQPGTAASAQGGRSTATSVLLRTARAAIGNDANLRQLRSLVMQGTTRIGFNGVTAKLLDPRSIEYRVLLPDAFLRITSDDLIQQLEGYAGDALLNKLKPVKPDVQFHYSPGPDELRNAQLQFARLALGMLAETRTVLALEVRTASATSSADTFAVSGPSGFVGFLDVDRLSHLPLRIRYEQSVQFRRPLTREEIKAGVTNPPDLKWETAEMALSFEDRRIVDGLSLPFRITRIARGVTFEEIQLQRILVNPPLTANDFK